MPPEHRNLIAFLSLAGAIVLAIFVIALWPAATPGPATGAAALVPGDALLYVHLSTDRHRPVVRQALTVAERFPDFPLAASFLESRLTRLLGATAASKQPDFGSQIAPWLGREGAVALLNTPTATAGTLIVLGVAHRSRAEAFLTGTGATPAGSYRGVKLLREGKATWLAFVRHYLVLGQRRSVDAAIDAASRHGRSLSGNPQYRQAAGGEPSDRVLDAYLSSDGVRRVLAAQGGLLGALGVLLYQPALTGTTLAVSPTSSGVRIRVHGALDPTLVKASGPPSRSFTPSLASAMPAGTTLLLEVSGLSRVAPRVLGAGAEGGIAGRVGPLLQRLGAALSSEGVNVRSITSLFAGETAVAVAPAAAGAKTKRGAGAPATHGPALVVMARTEHEAATRRLLASLQAPLAQLFPPPSSGPGQAPEFSNIPVAGITVHQLALAPGLQLDYAVFGGLVVVSTSLDAIALVARHNRSLSDDPGYQATVGSEPSGVTSLVFLNFSQLLNLAEQTGLTHSSRVTALRPDLDKIRAIGLQSTRGETDTTAELTLEIS